MESGGMTKKEYLKKYLSGGDKKKKKKKSTQSLIIKSKIVDDDIDLKNLKPIDDDELEIFDLAEEAPQIVGIIDERPEEIRVMSEYRSTKKWKIVTDEFGIEDVKITAIDRRKDEGSPKMEKEISIEITKNSDKKLLDSDESPPRRKINDLSDNKISKKNIESNSSASKRVNENEYDSDASPPRRKIKKEKNASPSTRTDNFELDVSPPRKIKKEIDSDSSPPRKIYKSDSDASPPRKRRQDDIDSSPKRRKHKDYSNSSSKKKNSESSLRHRSRNSDSQRNRREEGIRKSKSPPESYYKKKDYGLKVSVNSDGLQKDKKSSQLEKTLSGKKAGLQSAEDMKKESEKLKEKEKTMFKKMSDEVTGRNATAIVRNKKTGRRFDAKEEERKKREKEEKEAEKIAQYAVWGKGMKQVQERENKIKDDLYEMSKPLARYKDDKDLEEMLKNQEREGDPMLEYIRRKKKKSGYLKPEYEGSYMPNRYNIKPGHKWDGVDRSNGYEKRWFEEQNAKKAREEEAFKWSTYDM